MQGMCKGDAPRESNNGERKWWKWYNMDSADRESGLWKRPEDWRKQARQVSETTRASAKALGETLQRAFKDPCVVDKAKQGGIVHRSISSHRTVWASEYIGSQQMLRETPGHQAGKVAEWYDFTTCEEIHESVSACLCGAYPLGRQTTTYTRTTDRKQNTDEQDVMKSWHVR